MSTTAFKLEIAHVHFPALVRTRICAKCAMSVQSVWSHDWLQLHVIEHFIAERHCKRHACKTETCQYADYQRGCNHKQQPSRVHKICHFFSRTNYCNALISCEYILCVWLHLYISLLPQPQRHNKKQHVTSEYHTSPEACGHPRRADICVSLKNTKLLKKSSVKCKARADTLLTAHCPGCI